MTGKSSMKYIVIPQDRPPEVVEVEKFDFAEVQKACDGYVELWTVKLDTLPAAWMYANEESRIKGHEINGMASLITGWAVLGNVVLIGRNNKDLSQAWIDYLTGPDNPVDDAVNHGVDYRD